MSRWSAAAGEDVTTLTVIFARRQDAWREEDGPVSAPVSYDVFKTPKQYGLT